MRVKRDSGRTQVLDSIRNSGPIARIEIAEATGFSPATVTAITAEFLQAGLIVEIPLESPSPVEQKQGQARRGRPRVLLRLNGAAHVVAGLNVAHRSICVQLTDFAGSNIAEFEMPLAQPCMAADTLGHMILMAVAQSCDRAGIPIQSLSAIGVGIAGQINTETGFVHWSPSLKARNVALGPQLQAIAPCPVFIGNDANLVAKAEHLFGKAQGIDDFLVVTIEHGVGLGIVLGGRLYSGLRGCGAELGHIKVEFDGAPCQCGQRGCLEAYVGEYAILRAAQAENDAYDDVQQVFAAADAGDAAARKVLARARHMLAAGIASLLNIFDPQLIILAGTRSTIAHLYDDALHKAITGMAVKVDAPLPPIEPHHWAGALWAKGAAAYAIEGVAQLTIRDLAQSPV